MIRISETITTIAMLAALLSQSGQGQTSFLGTSNTGKTPPVGKTENEQLWHEKVDDLLYQRFSASALSMLVRRPFSCQLEIKFTITRDRKIQDIKIISIEHPAGNSEFEASVMHAMKWLNGHELLEFPSEYKRATIQKRCVYSRDFGKLSM